MTFLPIVERELRAAARRRSTFWVRVVAAAGVIVLAAWTLLVLGSDAPQQMAQSLFYLITGLALGVCLFGGLRFTADSMTEEKREGTLGLLFLTDLKGYDVVLGKLVANSVHAFYALLAALPVMAIPLLLGSFTLGHVVRVALALINALFFSLCAGMLASTISPTTRRALMTAGALVFIPTVGLPILGSWVGSRAGFRELAALLTSVSPAFTYISAAGPVSGFQSGWFWVSFCLVHALTWGFLILACMCAPRCWQDQPQLKTQPTETGAWQTWLLGSGAARVAHRRRLLERNPFYWRAARARFMPLLMWAALLLIAGVWMWGWAKYGRDWPNAATYVFTGLVLNAMLKLGVAAEATRPLMEERREGTLELLLSTPLSVRDILRGQALALQRVFLLPFVVVLVTEIVLLFAGLGEMRGAERPVWLGVWMAGMLMLVSDLVALYWVGMWRALAARSPRRAFSETVALVLVLPWLGFAVLLALIPFMASSGPEPSWEAALVLWLAVGIAADVGFGVWAHHKLLTEFRARAAERYAPRPPWWRRWRGAEAASAPASHAG